LAEEYSKAVQKYTPTGMLTINRATFIKIYNEIRESAFKPRNIGVGWKRSGLVPINFERVLGDPSVKDWLNT